MKITIHAKDQPRSMRTVHMVEKIEIESKVYGNLEIKPIGPEMDTLTVDLTEDTFTGIQSFMLDYNSDNVKVKHLLKKKKK